MRQSQLFSKTTKDISKQEVSINAQLLLRGGFVNQLMAGAYTYLPLGLRVLNKIENIVREEMNKVEGQEILMPALQPREIWDKTGRWDIDVLFRFKGAGDRDLTLGATHEETVTPLASGYMASYKDFPRSVYQTQTKFRNEARAKSGVLRGREFRMKDMYSFHTSQNCLDEYYDRVIQAYLNVYERVGLGDKTLLTFASGGIFSKYSHEFQTITDAGEDIIYKVPGTNIAINEEVIDDIEAVSSIIPNYQSGDEKNLEKVKTIEVGNIFKLGSRYANAFDFKYMAQDGTKQDVIMGCYGIGLSRLMGAVVECLHDENGIIWPKTIAPYGVHLVSLAKDDTEIDHADAVYKQLQAAGFDVLYDDRKDAGPGTKLADADLIGIPERLVISKKMIESQSVEWKNRVTGDVHILSLDKFISRNV